MDELGFEIKFKPNQVRPPVANTNICKTRRMSLRKPSGGRALGRDLSDTDRSVQSVGLSVA